MPKTTRRKSKAQLEAAGTARKDRARTEVFPISTTPEEWEPPAKPDWLPPPAAAIWDQKTAVYRARGQVTKGFEPSLAQYCALEALIVDQYRQGLPPPMAQVQQHRTWAAAFFDTPASTTISNSKAGVENPFLKLMKKKKG